jgi:tRNA pseudouridine55 synthase
MLSGWLNIYKPHGVNSTKITNIIKKSLGAKVGHAGTLDPLASGILPLALGSATRMIEYVQNKPKTYEFTIEFGYETDTLDLEGKKIDECEARPTISELEKILPEFTGKISQTPPVYSAVKVNGKRAYDLARSGQEVEIKSRKIEIYNLSILSHSGESRNVYVDSRLRGNDRDNKLLKSATLKCKCSKGTYIRSLARDISHRLNTLGTVTYLHRSEYGGFTEVNSLKLNFPEESLQNIKNQAIEQLIRIDTPLDDIPVFNLDDSDCNKLSNGQLVEAKILEEKNLEDGVYRIYRQEDKNFIAIANLKDGF